MNEYDGGGGMNVDGDDHLREAWALDRLCDALLARGAMVPLTRKWVASLSLSQKVFYLYARMLSMIIDT